MTTLLTLALLFLSTACVLQASFMVLGAGFALKCRNSELRLLNLTKPSFSFPSSGASLGLTAFVGDIDFNWSLVLCTSISKGGLLLAYKMCFSSEPQLSAMSLRKARRWVCIGVLRMQRARQKRLAPEVGTAAWICIKYLEANRASPWG